jgi:hypothetical protein
MAVTATRRRCSGTTSAGKPCARKALASGTCSYHAGHDIEPEPLPGKPCCCERPAWVEHVEGLEPKPEVRCLSCGRAPISSADDFASWLRRHPNPEPQHLAAVLRGHLIVKRGRNGAQR